MKTQDEPLWLAGWITICIEYHRMETVGLVYGERDVASRVSEGRGLRWARG